MNRRITSFVSSFYRILLSAQLAAIGQVHGQAALSNYQLTPADPHAVTLGYGQSSELNLTLTNLGSAQADWKLVFENSGPTDLAGTLESLDEEIANVLSVIPDRYLFSEGITGSFISDGGGDMYDSGNILRAAGTTLAYSNGVVANATVGAGSVSYFTRKYDGLFVFSADFTNVDNFAIIGNLGADGYGSVSVDEFTIQKGGTAYRAFVHRVHGAGDPSINHLILVPSKPGLSRSYLATTDDENHRISGLGASSRIYYLMFAKSSGGFYATQTFEDLADAFLGSVGGGPGWTLGNPATGSVAAGQAGSVKLTLDATGLAPGEYYTRFAVTPLAMDHADIPAGTFRDLTLTVGEPTFTIPTDNLTVASLSGVSPDPMTVTLAPAIEGSILSGLQTSSTASWLIPSVGTAPNTIRLTFDSATLAPGTHRAPVEVWNGETRQSFNVSVVVAPLNYSLVEADLGRPRIYAISQESGVTNPRASLISINSDSGEIEAVVSAGNGVTDLAIHYRENRIYLTNHETGILRAFDRDTLAQVQTYPFAPKGSTGYSEGDAYRVFAGKTGRIIVSEYDQWVDAWLIDTADGTILDSVGVRAGDGVFDPTGRYYYHLDLSSLRRFDTESDSFNNDVSANIGSGSPIVFSGNGTLLMRGSTIMTTELEVVRNLSLNTSYPTYERIYASTYGGELAITNRRVFNSSNGEALATHPFGTTLLAVSHSQDKLFLFDDDSFTVVDLTEIAELPPRGLTPGIPDGSMVIGTAQELSWSLEAAALSYDVYFGTSEAAVTSATHESPEYLGNSDGTVWTGSLPPFSLGQTYWWRVDTVGYNSTATGASWSFKVAPIDITPRSLDLAVPSGTPIPGHQLTLSSTPTMAWSASTTTPWITLASTSGSTPASLEFDLSSTGLATGLHEGSITIQTGNDTFTVPVSVRILELNVTKLVPHPTRPVVYGIHTTAADDGFSHLLEIDAATANILRSLPIGFSPTDADFDPASDRLYVTNWGYSQTRVIDVAAWTELPPLSLGEDVYKLEITPNGRILTEEEDQWISLSMWNAATGTRLSGTSSIVRQGDGEADPTGNFYYHCDSNISNAHITKYDISGNNFVSVATGPEIGYGSRNLILSADGSKLFWLARVLDPDLGVIGKMPAEVHATNRSGDLAIGAGAVWWSDSGTVAATLPFTSTIAAVSADDSHLLRFNATTRALHSTPLSDIADLPGPWPRPEQMLGESPDRLSWSPVAGATSYQVFIAPDAAALAAMRAPVASVTTTWYDIPSPLDFGRFYSWRVDAVIGSGVVSGSAQSFGINFPQGPPLAISGSGGAGISVSISDRHLLVGVQVSSSQNSAQLYQFDSASGTSSQEQSFALPGYYFDHQFGTAVAMDSGKAAVGAYAYDNPADGGGAALLFRQSTTGYWESSGPLAPPTPAAGEGFGRGLAAFGNLMLAGAGGSSSVPGRVAAYVTEPSAIQVQTFRANDGVANDGFGRVIAMTGNQAVISAPGRGPSYNRLPSLYAFSRSTTTGLWAQTQKIAIPEANTYTYNSIGTALALSRDILATNNGANGTVVIFTKNGSGQWIHSASINQSSIAGSSFSSFGKALAVSGDQLFVGDTGASYGGKSGGAVFSFRRSGTAWIPGPVIVPASYSSFGSALAARDGWLLATGGTSQPAWLFRVDTAANRTPSFREKLPTQVVAGRSFSTEVLADDADGNAGLEFDLLQGPSWLSLLNESNGRAVLHGTPAGNSGDVHTVQIRVRDDDGAEALYTYQLTLLAPTDLPSFTQEPAGGEAVEGQEVIFRADVEGTGPFQWQWFRGAEPIPGANGSRLVLAEASLADSGEYSVRVSNVVGEIQSAAITLDVHPATRFAGDWPTFGGNSRHTGYHPAKLDRHSFVPAWTNNIAPGRPLNRAATGNGMVFTTPNVYFGGSYSAIAVELATGAPVWNHAFESAFSLNPPTYHHGRVYIQRGNHASDTQLWSLDAETGATVWSSPHSSQWERYEAPTVTDDGIWINGGGYGGMYGFDLSGSQTFFRSLAQVAGWTPTVSGGRLFTWVRGLFQEHNPWDGTTLWSVTVNNLSYGNTGVSAISADNAVVVSSSEIVCIDLSTRSIRWRQAGSFIGTPAISNGRTYAIQGAKVVSYALEDGTPGPAVTVPAAIVSGQPLLAMDYLFVASAASTYVVDLATSTIVRTLPGGGLLSYSNGYLLAAGMDGTLRAWYANGAPEFTASLPLAINAGDAAPDFQMDLTDHVEDIDPGETLSWEIVSVSNPSIFRTFEIGPESGVLSVVYNPWTQGTSAAVIAVTDSAGNRTETTIEFTLPDLPDPLVTADPVIRFTRLTGLYEQNVTVTNIAQREIAGFELSITGLRAGVILYNGSTAGTGSGQISHRLPMAAGASVTLILEYYASPRGEIPLPEIVAAVALPDALSSLTTLAESAAPAFAVNRCVKQADGSLVIEFTAEPGKRYRIQYSEDAANWKSCPVSVQAGGTKVQWIDRGPPWTDAMPSSLPRRFYRVARIAD